METEGKHMKRVLFLTVSLLLFIYIAGAVAGLSQSLSEWSAAGGNPIRLLLGDMFQSEDDPELFIARVFNPIHAVRMLGVSPHNIHGLIVAGVLSILVILFLFKRGYVKRGTQDHERNFLQSNKGTYGTAGWMTKKEMHGALQIAKNANDIPGTILGEKVGYIVAMPQQFFEDTAEAKSSNRNVLVFGAVGTGKSRAYARNVIFQAVKNYRDFNRRNSLVITDPSSELYCTMAPYLRANGFTVKMFNLVNPAYSDSWNCLREIEGTEPELMAQLFADVVIKNTLLGNKPDPFWDPSSIALLTALVLYVGLVYDVESRNIGEVFTITALKSVSDLTEMFSRLEITHPARISFSSFAKASEAVQTSVLSGLALKLRIFQIEAFKEITRYNDIDLELPALQPCAYFCIPSEQTSAFDFMSSLFISFLFQKLVQVAQRSPGIMMPVPVHLLLDELANIGAIPDLNLKISTVRKYGISMSCVFQGIAQMESRYPNNMHLEIISACDTQLFLGCAEEITAKFISSRSGEITIGVESTAKHLNTIRITDWTPEHRESASVGKRFLLTPDEVLRLKRSEALVILRGEKILKVNKYDYSKHPEAKSPFLRDCTVQEHIPEHKKVSESGTVPRPRRIHTPEASAESATDDFNDEAGVMPGPGDRPVVRATPISVAMPVDTSASRSEPVVSRERQGRVSTKAPDMVRDAARPSRRPQPPPSNHGTTTGNATTPEQINPAPSPVETGGSGENGGDMRAGSVIEDRGICPVGDGRDGIPQPMPHYGSIDTGIIDCDPDVDGFLS